jgi:ribonuclease BN (tRNA processing enzyme)
MNITFLGTSSCIPALGSETASLVINETHLVDTGWYTALGMRRYGFDPLRLQSIILTHLHQDHYLGLASILFTIGLRGSKEPSGRPLRILGPGKYLAQVVDAAFDYLQVDRFPELRLDYGLTLLRGGDSHELDGLLLETCDARHVSGKGTPEPALSYRVTESSTGAAVTYSGDTSYNPALAEFSRSAELLIHDSAHSSPQEAAEIARAAAVEQLLLIHYRADQSEELLAEARQLFPSTRLARDGDTVTVGL